jgi:ubiquinone/menaquinone biosynthesis C-methylase UbiE
MTDQSASFVGSIPEYYDSLLGPLIFNDYASDLAKCVAGLQPDSVLELAAGTGIVSRKLRDTLPPTCSLLVSDLNPPMLEVARQKFQAGESVGFEALDATDLPFEDASFDALACQFGVMFFPDKMASYKEALRVLRPGGSYIFNVWGTWEQNPFARVAFEAAATFFPPDDPPVFYRVPFSYNDAGAIEAAITKAGFASVTTRRLRLQKNLPSAREFGRGLVFGNPLIDEIAARAGDPEQICAAVGDALHAQLGSDLSLEALVITCKKA